MLLEELVYQAGKANPSKRLDMEDKGLLDYEKDTLTERTK